MSFEFIEGFPYCDTREGTRYKFMSYTLTWISLSTERSKSHLILIVFMCGPYKGLMLVVPYTICLIICVHTEFRITHVNHSLFFYVELLCGDH